MRRMNGDKIYTRIQVARFYIVAVMSGKHFQFRDAFDDLSLYIAQYDPDV